MSKPRGLGFLSRVKPYLLVVSLAFSPLSACYAHAYTDGVYAGRGGGYYYDDGYRYRRRYYRDYPRYYRRGPDHYYRGDSYYYRGRRHDHHYHHRYRDW